MPKRQQVRWTGDGLDVYDVADVVVKDEGCVCPKCKEARLVPTGQEMWQRGLWVDVAWECAGCRECGYQCIIRSEVKVLGVKSFESFIDDLLPPRHDSDVLP